VCACVAVVLKIGLEELWSNYSIRWCNASIRRSLSGKKLEEVFFKIILILGKNLFFLCFDHIISSRDIIYGVCVIYSIFHHNLWFH
jgi:hypothetical protein